MQETASWSPLTRYASLVGTGRDEMLADDGSVRSQYRPLVDALVAMPEAERESRFRSASQYLSEAGVHHRIYRPGDADEEEREWPLSQPPLVVDPAEWAGLEKGLVQRAEFLERLLADIYGERALVRDGVLPGAILGSNPEFLRPLAGQGLSGQPLIRFIAVDLGRGPDGRWWVLGDRTQAPSGAGFALENRVATSKAFPDLARQMNVERLAAFFQRFREMLHGLAGGDMSSIGLLTPGPHNETYFEHAYLARYLGLLLLEGGDLVVHRDRADVRTVDGFQPIRVLWRRLDAEFCDPLELFGGSRIGTPGLLRAIRSGALAVINAPGSGILESRALMAFQKPLAKALIGAELALPTIATWWCGQKAERRFVEANLHRLQLASAFPPAATAQPVADPVALDWADALTAGGTGVVAEEIAALSTAPVFIDGQLEPRPVTWRVFLSRDDRGWHVMPGGFARIADSRDARAVSMQAGGRSADVWVPSRETPRPVTLLPRERSFVRRVPGALPARAADNLFWLGRYAERCEVATRLVRLYAARVGEVLPSGEIDARLEALLAEFGVAPDAMAKGLLALARRAADTASRIRDRFSPDGWRTLDELVELIQEAHAEKDEDTVALANQILTRLSGFTGLVRENMYQFAGWRFMQCGRRIERGRMSAHIASVLLAGDAPEGALEGLLEFTDSRVTYRRRYSVDLSRETVVDLTVLDPLNPRSVAFQVNSLVDRLAELPGMHAAETPDLMSRRIARLKVRLQTADATEVDTAFLDRVEADLGLISDLLTERYLLSSPGARPDRAAPE
ncbi:MAG: circularly permuted type 2 ATP-grasp protein [Aurantimonas endophytica]|uniref:circularly permuted type 2 ATP-grasp protein n=1 Tax=Aurantimonas endophytica TaxID=1522175 RepID=UPI0030013F4C